MKNFNKPSLSKLSAKLGAFRGFYRTLAMRLGVTNKWQVAIKSQVAWMGYLLRCSILVTGKAGKSNRLLTLQFARYTIRVYRHMGPKGLVQLLKASSMCIMKYTDFNTPIRSGMGDLKAPLALTNDGLPRWIPALVRVRIRLGDKAVIAYLLSLCSVYRIIECSGKVSDTITAPGVNVDWFPYIGFIPTFTKWFAEELRQYTGTMLHPKSLVASELPESIKQFNPKDEDIPPFTVKPVVPLMIHKSGPGSKSKPVSVDYGPHIADIPAGVRTVDWVRDPGVYLNIANSTSAMMLQACSFVSKNKDMLPVIKKFATFFEGGNTLIRQLVEIGNIIDAFKSFKRFVPRDLGKLGFKQEPAGKVRVFAMVTWWDQVLLSPLHGYIFSLLRCLAPVDGTFDQDKTVQYGLTLYKKTAIAYSFDLTAATDRLPIVIQARLVDMFFPGLGPIWAELLIGRAYSKGRRKSVRYSVGQPMGALSSWPMLAITHHFIVQYAAFKAGHTSWFKDYILLGDDLVIFDKEVAAQYLIIMKDLGVGINLTKSLQSETAFEFAKRFCYRGEALPIVAFREMDVAAHSLDGLIQMLRRVGGPQWKLGMLMKFKGFGYRALSEMSKRLSALPRSRRLLMVMLSFPGISPLSFSRLTDWLSMIRLGQSDSSKLDLETLASGTQAMIEASAPIGQTAELVARDIVGPTGFLLRDFNAYEEETALEAFEDNYGNHKFSEKTIRGVKSWRDLMRNHWRLENLEHTVQAVLWPLQLGYMANHRLADAHRAEMIKLQSWDTIDGAEGSLLAYLDWLAENSLTPAKVNISDFKEEEIKTYSATWLNFWARLRPAATVR